MWALLPLKSFADAKQRLSGVLSPEERRGLFQAMVKDVLSVLQLHPDIENTLIVSVDPVAKQLAQEYGAEFLDESTLNLNGINVCGLNEAVQSAVDELAHRGIDDVMIIHGDLPLISADEISHLIRAHRQQSSSFCSPTLTIAPDDRREGTNCLLCTPASSMKYCYGSNSFTLHAIQASHIYMPLQVVCLPGVGCDIDTPQDLAILIERADSISAIHSYRYITANDLAERLGEVTPEPIAALGMQYSWVG